MPMKKHERKDSFAKIISLMLKGENKQAYNILCCMCGEDTGLFIFADYDKAMEDVSKEKDYPNEKS